MAAASLTLPYPSSSSSSAAASSSSSSSASSLFSRCSFSYRRFDSRSRVHAPNTAVSRLLLSLSHSDFVLILNVFKMWICSFFFLALLNFISYLIGNCNRLWIFVCIYLQYQRVFFLIVLDFGVTLSSFEFWEWELKLCYIAAILGTVKLCYISVNWYGYRL